MTRAPVQIPATPEQRRTWYAAAKAEGLTFAAWARRLLVKAAAKASGK